MRRARIRAATLLAGLVAVLAACGGAEGTRQAQAKRLRVGVVFDIGGRGDGGFNEGAATGAERAAQDGGVELQFVDIKTDADRDAAIARLAAEKLDLVIGIGFLTSGSLTKAAQAHPDQRFAAMDYAIPTNEEGRAILPPPNLAAVTFREEEGAYLVGAVAGLTTRSKVVGFVGGMDSPMIRRFEAGFDAGVRRVCEQCRVLSRFAGTTPEAFRDPAAGYAIAGAQYAAGADVIFHASGGTGFGVFRAARETGRRVIGVDVDQSKLAPANTQTSMLKRLDVAVADVIARTRRNEFRGGLQSYGLAEDGLGYVYDERNRAMISDDVRRHVEVLREGIVAGLITVPTSR